MIAMIHLFTKKKTKNSEKQINPTLFLKFSRANELIFRQKFRVKCACLPYISCFFFITRLDFAPYNGKKMSCTKPIFSPFSKGLFLSFVRSKPQRLDPIRA